MAGLILGDGFKDMNKDKLIELLLVMGGMSELNDIGRGKEESDATSKEVEGKSGIRLRN